jgi:hypothetical protein
VSWRIFELAQDTAPRELKLRDPSAGGGQAPSPSGTGPSGSGRITTSFWDPFGDVERPAFTWDGGVALGWDNAYWLDHPELVQMWMQEDLTLRVGIGEATLINTGTATRVNEDGGVDDLDVNEPIFNWIPGPNGYNRYCLEIAGDIFTIPTARNMARSQGSISMWMRAAPLVSFLSAELYMLQAGAIVIQRPFGVSDELQLIVTLLDGSTVSATVNYEFVYASGWCLLVASWSRAEGRVRFWINDEPVIEVPIAQRLAELSDVIQIGDQIHIADFRIWPREATDELVANLFAIKA